MIIHIALLLLELSEASGCKDKLKPFILLLQDSSILPIIQVTHLSVSVPICFQLSGALLTGFTTFVPCEVHQIVWPETSFTDPQKSVSQVVDEKNHNMISLLSLKISQKKKFCPTCDSQTVEQKMPVKSDAGETMAWSESVDTLLANKDGLAAFRTFLKSEFSEENVEFWLACEDFKKTKSSPKITSKAQKIYSDFIQANAPKEINIDFHTKTHISQNISEPTLSCFDDAQRSIYSLMAKDSFPRFLRSEMYKELVKKQQHGNQKRWLPFL